MAGTSCPTRSRRAIERTVARGASDDHRPTGADVGRVRDLPDAADEYVAHLLGTVDRPLTGSPSSSTARTERPPPVAPEVYRRAGATVHAIGYEPDGWNINDGIGSTHLGPLIEAVRATGADLGIAHDGDADRCLAVDRRAARSSTATRSWPSARSRCTSAASSRRTPSSPPS